MKPSVLFQEIFRSKFLSTVGTVPHLPLVSFHVRLQQVWSIKGLNNPWYCKTSPPFLFSADSYFRKETVVKIQNLICKMRVVFGFPIYISLAFHCVWMNWLGRVIYTLAEFLFYILVCITLSRADKKSAFHTSCLHPHASHTFFLHYPASHSSCFTFYFA